MKQYSAKDIRNVAIVGHGGSGKTMLAEHMLYTAGATDRVGTVDSGNTQSDFDPLEVKRKISLNASVLPFEWHGVKVNLIDVPGYSDFMGDLHAVARVVESMIIVTEAKRDLDVGFDLAMEVAEQHGLATCIFVNKLERDNADYEGLIETLHERFGKKVVGVQIPIGKQAAFSGVLDLLRMKVYKGRDRGEEMEEIPSGYAAEAAERREKMMDAAAEGDDELMMKYLDGEELTEDEIEHGLLLGIENGKVIPVLIGSAQSGIGVATLLDRIIHELPSPVDMPKAIGDQTFDADPSKPACAFVFKTSADPYVGKINYMRVLQGKLIHDAHVINTHTGQDERLHNMFYPHGKNTENVSEVVAGDICAVAKLTDTHTGDTLCGNGLKLELPGIDFPAPIYRVAIVPSSKADEDKLGGVMAKLLEEDPTIRYSRDPVTHQDILEGMGDIHLETVIDKLKSKFGVSVQTTDARIPYRETFRSGAKAQGRHKRQTGGKGQFGDCWIEVTPLPRGDGFQFENKVVGGAIPKNFIPAIEKGVREQMDRGLVAGYPVVDMRVTVYDGSYHDVDSNEQAFKTAGAIALREAASKAGVSILEPVVNVEVDVPDDCVGDVVGDLNTRRGHLAGMEPSAPGKTKIRATAPMSMMARYALDLRSITKGRGRFAQSFSHYDEMPHPEQQALMAEYEKQRTSQED